MPSEGDSQISADTEKTLGEVAKILGIRPQELATHPVSRPIYHLVLGVAGGGAESDGPVRETFARLGDKWIPFLLYLLRGGPLRYGTLHRLVNVTSVEKAISQRMLTLGLRSLERDGFVQREVNPTPTPQVTYSLTPFGRELADRAFELTQWLDARRAEIWRARLAFEAKTHKAGTARTKRILDTGRQTL